MKALMMMLLVSSAHARDVNVCATIGDVLQRFESENEQAQFAVQNEDVVCAEAADKAACKAQIETHAAETAKHLASVQKSYHDAGCDEAE